VIRTRLSDWASRASYAALLRDALEEMGSVLDVGCGRGGVVPTAVHPGTEITGVDILEQPCPTDYVRYVQGDIRDLTSFFPADSFDCVVALDVIEHLPKEEGYTFLSDLEQIARERIVLFTPNGFLAQAPYDGNPFQEHLSGWNVEELTAHGFEILGVNGWRPLRGERAQIRLRPVRFWSRVSVLSQPLVIRRPDLAFQLLGTKKLTG
jgi:SAM-dependent methyltransferase